MEVTTALMAAVGMVRATPWVPVHPAVRESLTLEAVKLAVELGVDINAANTDGRTALDVAKALRFESVTQFLTAKSAK